MSTITLKSSFLARILRLAPLQDVTLVEDGVVLFDGKASSHLSFNHIDRLHCSHLGTTLRLLMRSGESILLARLTKRSVVCAFERAFRRARLIALAPAMEADAHQLRKLLEADSYLARTSIRTWLNSLTVDTHGLATPFDDLQLDQKLLDNLELLRAWIGGWASRTSSRNEAFIERELKLFTKLFDGIEARPLTDRQRLAAVRNEDCNLVVAGAGTGKTSTVMARVAYLLARQSCTPQQILVLAYARKAKEELQERIEARIGQSVEVRTFHGLGASIIGKATGKMPALSKVAEDRAEADRRIERYLSELLEDATTREPIVRFFAYYLRPYKDESSFATADAYYRHLRSQDIRSLKGELVKSHQEMVIANWLFLHGIRYEYEAPYGAAETADATHRRYQPDFFLTDHEIYIEHFGIDRTGKTAPFIDQDTYHKQMRWKRELHTKYKTQLVETFSYEFSEGILQQRLADQLRQRGVMFHPLSVADLKQALGAQRNARPIVGLIRTFLELYKSSGQTITNLYAALSQSGDQQRAVAFLHMFERVMERYEADLRKEAAIDFADMIRSATLAVKEGTYQSPFRHIIVDEFQDIAAGRAELIKALLHQVRSSRLFVVGDDWQSIYRFAGSDVSLMTTFESHFGPTVRTDLDCTFRFSDRLLDATTRFVTSNPEQLKKEMVALKKEVRPPISVRWSAGKTWSLVGRLLKEIAAEVGDGTATVIMLGRYRHVFKGAHEPMHPTDLDEFDLFEIEEYGFHRSYPNLTVSLKTVHASKGLEADFVVLLDVNTGRFGFPTEMADDPLLGMVLAEAGQYPNAEERRLFYVALTRARKRVYVVADEANASPFVTELAGYDYAQLVDFEDTGYLPAYCPACGGTLVRREGEHGVFWGCRNYPYCTGKGDQCSQCGKGVIAVKLNESMQCNVCQFVVDQCPQCKSGHLRTRSGKYGEFWGCSRFPDCHYTRDTRRR